MKQGRIFRATPLGNRVAILVEPPSKFSDTPWRCSEVADAR